MFDYLVGKLIYRLRPKSALVQSNSLDSREYDEFCFKQSVYQSLSSKLKAVLHLQGVILPGIQQNIAKPNVQ